MSWNRAAQALFGYRAEEVIGKHASMLVGPEQRELPAQVANQLAQGESVRPFETLGLKKDGTRVEILVSASSMAGQHGDVVGTSVIIRDITERKRIEESPRASEEQFRQLAENVRQVFFVAELRPLRLIYISPACEEIFRRSRQEVYERPESWLEAVHPEDHGATMDFYRRCFQTGEGRTEYRIVWPDGSTRSVREQVFPVHDAAGALYRVVGTVEDITERERAEEMLRFSEMKLALKNRIANIFLTVPDDQTFGNVLGVVLEAMNSQCGLFGYIDETGALVIPTLRGQIWDECRMPGKTLRFPMESMGRGLGARPFGTSRDLFQ